MRKIFPVAVALFVLLAAMPVMPSSATGNTRVTVSPGDARADIDSFFDITVDLSDSPPVCGYDVTLRYNNQVLSVASASLGHTLFDLENDGDVSSDVNLDGISDVFVARANVEQETGTIRFGLVLVAIDGITVTTPVPLFMVTFHVDNAGSSSLDLREDTIVTCTGRGVRTESHKTFDGTYNLPAILVLGDCSPDSHSLHGPTNTITCTVTNTGGEEQMARLDYQFAGAESGSGSAGPTAIPAGSTTTMDFSITSAACDGRVDVAVSLIRVIGDLDVPAGSADTFYNIHQC